MSPDPTPPTSPASGQPDANVAVYDDPAIVARFSQFNGWINVGERTAVLGLADLVRGKRILDIGVGAGRTVSLLRLLSDAYVGVDYTPGQVTACQRRYPHLDIRLADG